VHESVPKDRQEGWPMFCHLIALPLLEGRPSILRCFPNLKTVRITRKRYDRWAVVAWPLSIGVACLLWRWLELYEVAALALGTIGGWLLMRLNVPIEGTEVVILQRPYPNFPWRAFVVWPLVSLALCIMHAPDWLATLALLIWFAEFVFLIYSVIR